MTLLLSSSKEMGSHYHHVKNQRTGIYYALGSMLNSSKDYFHIIQEPCHCYSSVKDEETEAQKLNNLPQVTN